jgi:Raf kinase inhibitor-like YbhB/YbcL family protein
MQIHSPAFSDGAGIPRRYTCDGQDVSPPLEWSGLPAETHSLVLLCDDPDAPAGRWHHWAAYDISPNSDGLPEGVSLV